MTTRRAFLGGVCTAALFTACSRAAPAVAQTGGRVYGTGLRAGAFSWIPKNLRAEVAADPLGAVFIPEDSDRSGRTGAWVRDASHGPAGDLRPEWFGALGDGRTNDTVAFAALSALLQFGGGGTVTLRAGATYIVGRQTLGGAPGIYSWAPDPIIRCHGATRPVIVNGQGARLKAARGLRYGTFNPVTGRPLATKAPYLGAFAAAGRASPEERASPYVGMIDIESCTAGYTIRDVTLEGSIANLILGGEWGDIARQIPGSGLSLLLNSGPVLIENVVSDFHAWDGALFCHNSTPADARHPIRITRYRARNNGRQGFSLTGGLGATFTDCEFARTGRTRYRTEPAAGIDIEAEQGRIIRDAIFVRCTVSDNAGAGFLGSVNDAERITCRDCTFVGTTSPAIYNSRPGSRYYGCTIVGQNLTGYDDPTGGARAYEFHDCLFTDDPKRSPTGRVYPSAENLAISDPLSGGGLYNRCTFRCIAGARLPTTHPTTRYRDCTFEQTAMGAGSSYGQYYGKNVVRTAGGFFGLSEGGRLLGSLEVNGVAMPRR